MVFRRNRGLDTNALFHAAYLRLTSLNLDLTNFYRLVDATSSSNSQLALLARNWLEIPAGSPGDDVMSQLARLLAVRLQLPDDVPLMTAADGPELTDIMLHFSPTRIPGVSDEGTVSWFNLQCARIGYILGDDPEARSRFWLWTEPWRIQNHVRLGVYLEQVADLARRLHARNLTGDTEGLNREIEADSVLLSAVFADTPGLIPLLLEWRLLAGEEIRTATGW